MAPQTRRVSARLADMRLASDVDMEERDDDIDVENDEQDIDEADAEGEDEEDGEDEDEEDEEEDDEEDEDEGEDEERDEMQSEDDDEDDQPIPSPRKSQPRLRIKLNLGASKRITSSTNSTARPTPEAEATPSRLRTRRRTRSDIDVESEEPTSPESEDEGDEIPSESRPTGRPMPMTTRQAVLASMVDSSHVSLDEVNRSKKKVLNETELALRREETARKRRNLTEKKLEDEKAETINRLLKKQTRPRNKRGTALDDRSPMPSSQKVKAKQKAKDEEGEENEENEEEEEPMVVVEEEIKPAMYRWISSKQVDGEETRMILGFSVPPDMVLSPPITDTIKPKEPSYCAVEGCGLPRKYRLVKDWTIGACGLPHLKLLEGR